MGKENVNEKVKRRKRNKGKWVLGLKSKCGNNTNKKSEMERLVQGLEKKKKY